MAFLARQITMFNPIVDPVYFSAGASICSAKSQVLRGHTLSVPRRLVVLIVVIGHAQVPQGLFTGSFHTAYLQSG